MFAIKRGGQSTCMPSAWSKFAMVHLQTGPYFGDEDADGDGNADDGDGNADGGDGNADDDWKKLAAVAGDGDRDDA